jgi:hypothetical protein
MELTVTGPVPDEVNVIDWVIAEFSAALPKFRVDALTSSCGVTGIVP